MKKTLFKKIIHTLFVLTVILMLGRIQSSFAQDSNVQNHPGKITYRNAEEPWPALFKNDHRRTYHKPILKKVAATCAVISKAPVVNPPKGFNIGLSVEPLLGDPYSTSIPHMQIMFANYVYSLNKQSGKIVQARTFGSDLRLTVNNPYILLNQYLRDDYEKAGVKPFHYKPDMHRDANGFWVVKGIKMIHEARIVKRKDRPLFIPLTQKQYLKFEIKWEQSRLKDAKKTVASEKNTIRGVTNKSEKNSLIKDLASYEEGVTEIEEAIKDYQSEMNIMPAEKLKAPAYISPAILPSKKGHYYSDLVSPSAKKARELVRINPTYMDESLSKNAIQLMVISTYYAGGIRPDIIKKLEIWFNQIDYKKLQAMIH
jgi:hypothetical protein